MDQVLVASAQRFTKSERIRKRFDYLRVQTRGDRIHLADLLVFVIPASARRVGITVSSKVGNAVCRNRVKRLLREAWRLERRAIPEGFDVVLVAKRRAAHASLHDFRHELVALGRKVQRKT